MIGLVHDGHELSETLNVALMIRSICSLSTLSSPRKSPGHCTGRRLPEMRVRLGQ